MSQQIYSLPRLTASVPLPNRTAPPWDRVLPISSPPGDVRLERACRTCQMPTLRMRLGKRANARRAAAPRRRRNRSARERLQPCPVSSARDSNESPRARAPPDRAIGGRSRAGATPATWGTIPNALHPLPPGLPVAGAARTGAPRSDTRSAGAGEGTRTRNLRITNPPLYQLSYASEPERAENVGRKSFSSKRNQRGFPWEPRGGGALRQASPHGEKARSHIRSGAPPRRGPPRPPSPR